MGKQFQHIRLATKEEIESIRTKADYVPNCSVYALEQNEGEVDLGVVRNIIELDPVVFGSKTTNSQKAKFLYLMEERLLGAGVEVYYSMVPAADETYRSFFNRWGFEETSTTPEIRIKRVLGR